MTQDIIVYSLITAALINVVYRIAKMITNKQEPECGSCPSCQTKTAHKRSIPKHIGI